MFVNGTNSLTIGEGLSLGEYVFFIVQEGTSLTIGKNCQIANNVIIRTSDSHSILNSTGERINKAESITIGNNVWVGEKTEILKGCRILDNTVIGCMSVCTKKQYEANSIYAGIPAKLIKQNISWDARQL